MKSETRLNGLLGIPSGAYKNNKELREIVLEEGVEYIGENAFYGCTSLTYASIPASCTRIDAYAFAGCTNLRGVAFRPNGKRIKIHPQAFRNSGLSDILLPGRCFGTEPFEMGWFRKSLRPRYYDSEKIYQYPDIKVVREANEMKSKLYGYYDEERNGYFISGVDCRFMDDRLVIPYKIDEKLIIGICSGAFENWTFNTVVLPFTCRYIDENAFQNCWWLEKVEVYFDPNEIKVHPKAFQGCPIKGKEDFTRYDNGNDH